MAVYEELPAVAPQLDSGVSYPLQSEGLPDPDRLSGRLDKLQLSARAPCSRPRCRRPHPARVRVPVLHRRGKPRGDGRDEKPRLPGHGERRGHRDGSETPDDARHDTGASATRYFSDEEDGWACPPAATEPVLPDLDVQPGAELATEDKLLYLGDESEWLFYYGDPGPEEEDGFDADLYELVQDSPLLQKLGGDHLFFQSLELFLRTLAGEYAAQHASPLPPSSGQTLVGGEESSTSKRAPPKRRRNQSDGDRSDDEDQSEPRSSKRQRKQPHSPPLACPFYKRDPITHVKCSTVTLSKLSYVKQHLNRKHQRPPHCPVCGMVFDSQDEVTQHLRSQRPRCDIRNFQLAGITEDQWAQIRDIVSRNSESERWFRIWDILFGSEQPPPPRPRSAYVEHAALEHLAYVREYCASDSGAQADIIAYMRDTEVLPVDEPEAREDIIRGLFQLILRIMEEGLIQQPSDESYTYELAHDAAPDLGMPVEEVPDEIPRHSPVEHFAFPEPEYYDEPYFDY
ncbi:hypothetical protein GQ53DRAFT_330986 [Thozetella sp. PMI_491]|nr:hypothetical protein GQ53DRAFT_330986 [Thozetella sp. PMI_491]